MSSAATTSSPLREYKVLSAKAGVRVSPVCLGAMNFGEAWKARLGECSKAEAFAIMDAYFEAGGNFIDTANNYQDNESEIWIGEWLKQRKNRDQIVLATKFTSPSSKPGEVTTAVNSMGNSSKSLHVSVRRSLENLGTDYIDLLYVHWWDYTTSIHELMQALNALVLSGKVLYLGASDMPAWVVASANTYAREKGFAQFVVYQGKWNVAQRDFERDILPMTRAFGMALAPWAVMLQGASKTTEEKSADKGRESFHAAPKNLEAVLKAVDEIAKEFNATRQQVCIAYVIYKEPQTFPILGGRKAAHLLDNIKGVALVKKLTPDHITRLEEADKDFAIGFPHDMVGTGDLSKSFVLNLMSQMAGGVTVSQPPHTIPQI